MIYIVLSVLLNSFLFVVFKLVGKWQIPTFQVLVFNYFVAFLVGLLVMQTHYDVAKVLSSSWFVWSLFLGFLFISVFFVTGKTAQQQGLSVASVASKMSVIIPVLSGVFIFREYLNFVNIIGILIALMAVYLSTKKEKGDIISKSNLILPILLFFGAGTIDTLLKVIQHFYVNESEITLFSMTTFLTAGLVGASMLTISIFRKKQSFKVQSIAGGLLLGIPNFFSLFYMIKMLDHPTWNSATIFTFHNVAIVLVTTLTGVFIFKEKLHQLNWIGVSLAVLALILVTYQYG